MVRALSFGEILWDIIDGKPYVGGAPFNLAAHLARMGAHSAMVSGVGTDDLGERAIASAEEIGVSTELLCRSSGRPTGTVDVFLSAGGQPEYVINENTAWDAIDLSAGQLAQVSNGSWDVFCFGTLAQRTAGNRRLLETIRQAAAAPRVVYDVNLRQRYYDREWIEESLLACTILKLNVAEAELLSHMFFGQTVEVEQFCEQIAERYSTDMICVTDGGDGAAVWASGAFAWVPGVPVDVADTVGAGDAFTAALVTALEADKSPVEATRFACRIGAWVASRRGAIPEYTAEISDLVAGLRR